MSAGAPRHSGRRTLLAAFAALVAIVGLLLSGRGGERQICLRTLEQRERTAWRIGSFELQSGGWREIDAWPDPVWRRIDARAFAPPALSPAGVARLLWPEGASHVWTTTRRSMPFALVMRIENPSVLPLGLADVAEAQLLARSIVDPGTGDGRACLLRLDAALLEGVAVPESLTRSERRQYRDRPAAEGELLAARLLDGLAEAARAGDVAAARNLMCGPLPPGIE